MEFRPSFRLRHSTELAVQAAKEAEAAGAYCLMLLQPFFLKPPLAALEHHIRAVGEAVTIPVIVQYAPEQTGVAIAPEIFIRLDREVETLRYFKVECKPSGVYISKLLDGISGQGGVF
ncbi:MAG TPA: dihydrodipicolinate synthase family protein [Armatimonadota bacterium]|nr:dihydrodipicolinate synthase family protein [Armatimonadota bacterium]